MTIFKCPSCGRRYNGLPNDTKFVRCSCGETAIEIVFHGPEPSDRSHYYRHHDGTLELIPRGRFGDKLMEKLLVKCDPVNALGEAE